MKTFLQYITEAGIRRKQRVAAATEKQAIAADSEPGITPREKRAANVTAILAAQDVEREQESRIGRVLKRAKSEAEHSEPSVSAHTAGGAWPHVERMERVGEKAVRYAGEMVNVEKPGFVGSTKKPLTPRGNDGY